MRRTKTDKLKLALLETTFRIVQEVIDESGDANDAAILDDWLSNVSVDDYHETHIVALLRATYPFRSQLPEWHRILKTARDKSERVEDIFKGL